MGAQPTSARLLQEKTAAQERGAGRELAAKTPQLRGDLTALCMSRHEVSS